MYREAAARLAASFLSKLWVTADTISEMDILQKIMAERKIDVERARKLVPERNLLKEAESRRHHSLTDRLRSGSGPCIIAEVKKASPSAGLLRNDYQPAGIALGFQEGGAAGISVLTEPHHFLGSEDDLRSVRKAVDIPVLRKDFLCDVYQVYEAAAWGADLVLLIVAALERPTLTTLYKAAEDMGLEVLVEAHTADEVRAALEFRNSILGVNSRDLKTLRTDLSVAKELAHLIPAGRLSIAESGIKSREDMDMLGRVGYNGFLVGELLMKSGDPRRKLVEISSCS